MKLQFFLDKFKNDLNALPQIEGKVNLMDVGKVVKRWEQAFINEKQLVEYEHEFQKILAKQGRITLEEFNEGFRLVMLIHMPLIQGENDVIALRLRDVDILRLRNKLIGQDIEEGVDEYQQAVDDLFDQHEREKKKRKQEQVEKQRKNREAKKRQEERRNKEIAKELYEMQQNKNNDN